MFSLRAFLRLELQRIKSGISWFESKTKIRRVAVTAYLKNPIHIKISRRLEEWRKTMFKEPTA